MRRKMQKLIGLRLADPAFSLIEELAIDDDRKITQMARRLLLERLEQIVIEREQHTPTASGDTAGTAAV